MCAYLAGAALAGACAALAAGWKLALAGLAVVPLSVLAAALVARAQAGATTRELAATGAAGRVADEVLDNVRTVRAYGAEETEVRRYVHALRYLHLFICNYMSAESIIPGQLK